MKLGPVWLDWSDLSFSTRDTSMHPHGWRQRFALRCGLCRAWTLSCGRHWFCGICVTCRRTLGGEDE